jgi:hypothetical protein
MTHKELLAKVDTYTCCSGIHEIALREVIKLHVPRDFEIAPDVYKLVCVCQIGAMEMYPCSTIRTIMNELQ